MTRICFICLGNICRSPMAEYILKQKLKDNNIKDIIVESRAISYEEQGNPIYPEAKKVLLKNNIEVGNHTAKRIEKDDINKFDYFICMEDYHVSASKNILGNNISIFKLTDYDIEDPWYTRNFDKVYKEIDESCNNILSIIKNNKSL